MDATEQEAMGQPLAKIPRTVLAISNDLVTEGRLSLMEQEAIGLSSSKALMDELQAAVALEAEAVQNSSLPGGQGFFDVAPKPGEIFRVRGEIFVVHKSAAARASGLETVTFELFRVIDMEKKPADMSDEEWKGRLTLWKGAGFFEEAQARLDKEVSGSGKRVFGEKL